LIPQLLSFFVRLIFLIFLDFTYQHRLEWGKSVILKYIPLKVEHVPKIFKNLNSFETMLKMLKTMQIYLKTYIFLFSLFFAIFGFVWNFYQKGGSKIR
jgi:hypothetical protein